MRYVAAFRAYEWDVDIAALASRFFDACPAARQVVLADETRGPLGITGYEVISHTEDTSKFGLFVYPPGNSLWHNVDYGLHILRARLPGYDYYLTSESDLAVNLPLDPIVAQAAAAGLDLVAHGLRPATADWYWYQNAIAWFDAPLGSLLYFMIASAAAIDLLWHMRRQMSAQFTLQLGKEWPFCEVFVPTLLKMANMRMAEIGAYADTQHLRLRPRLLLSDPRANRPGSLCHSVLGKRAYVRAALKEHPATDWRDPGSELRRVLAPLAMADYAAPLEAALRRAGDLAPLTDPG
jgi:hypothetical protein